VIVSADFDEELEFAVQPAIAKAARQATPELASARE
jgi:hypothetical protein